LVKKLLALLVLLLSVIGAQASTPSILESDAEKTVRLIRELARSWEFWPQMPVSDTSFGFVLDDGSKVTVGTYRKVSRKTSEFGPVQVVMVYAFGDKQYSFVRVFFGTSLKTSPSVLALRGTDGSLIIPAEIVQMQVKVDEKTHAVQSITFDYRLSNGVTGLRTFSAKSD
jgi:hypothetical protein